MLKTNPRKIVGNWAEGYALDAQVVSSSFVGYDEFGHPRFDTTRSELGEHLYKLKYGNERAAVGPIVETVAGFIASWKIPVDMIVPVPPSNLKRSFQPLLELARALGAHIGIPVCEDCLVKVKETPQLKNVQDFPTRAKILESAFTVSSEKTRRKNVLVFDDLYQSGATLNAIVGILNSAGLVANVYVLAVTRAGKN